MNLSCLDFAIVTQHVSDITSAASNHI